LKIIHTADWHIGKRIYNIHMTEDQEYILKQLIKLLEYEKPDVLIIAGDIYDRSIPPTEAVELLDSVLTDIVTRLKIKIIAISGNHDDNERVCFVSKILENNGLYIKGDLKDIERPIVLNDEFGEVNFYSIPYVNPAIVNEEFKNDKIKSHDDAMKAIVEKININKKNRNICITHGFITGMDELERSESEKCLSVGGTENVDVEYFKEFNYVALGHLHRPQRVKYDYIRYSGSLMKYSFSEALQEKSITIIDLDKNGKVNIEFKKLEILRDMRKIEGKLDQLMNINVYKNTNIDDYIMAVLTDSGELIEPMRKLQSVYKNILNIEKKTICDSLNERTSASKEFSKKDIIELFEEFYCNIESNSFDEIKKIEMQKVINHIIRNRGDIYETY